MITIRPAHPNDDLFVAQNAPLWGFLQSSIWASALTRAGRTIEHIAFEDNGATVGVALIDWRKPRLGGRFAFLPKGPVGSAAVMAQLTEYIREKGAAFIRVEPKENLVSTERPTSIKDINPPATLVLDITKPSEMLLAAMHPKTRYNIRLSEKKHVHVEPKKSFDIFWSLLKKTGSRDGFALHTESTYKAVMEAPEIEQLIAYVGEKPVATGCFIRFGSTVSYLYGASDHLYRDYMAPHLVQWRAIERAKAAGATTYNFFGVSPGAKLGDYPVSEYTFDQKHRYAGVTRFKVGFGGMVHQEPGTIDYVLSGAGYLWYKTMHLGATLATIWK